MALNQNEDLQNIRGTKFQREMRVPGILRTARGEGRLGPVRSLRDDLGMSGPTRKTVVDVSAPTISESPLSLEEERHLNQIIAGG
jgi:hypothetical protein